MNPPELSGRLRFVERVQPVPAGGGVVINYKVKILQQEWKQEVNWGDWRCYWADVPTEYEKVVDVPEEDEE
jgi:hypothetical protein